MMEYSKLVKEALDARKTAYAPYSGFYVGAALIDKNGNIYKGCNIENAAYTPTNCAERTAFFKAVSEGVTEFLAIAVVGGHKESEFEKGQLKEYCAPCGVCRQVMAEFCSFKDFEIVLGKSEDDYKVYKLRELLPLGFSPADLR